MVLSILQNRLFIYFFYYSQTLNCAGLSISARLLIIIYTLGYSKYIEHVVVVTIAIFRYDRARQKANDIFHLISSRIRYAGFGILQYIHIRNRFIVFRIYFTHIVRIEYRRFEKCPRITLETTTIIVDDQRPQPLTRASADGYLHNKTRVIR